MKAIIQGQITILEKMNSMNFEAVEKMIGRGVGLTDHAFRMQNQIRENSKVIKDLVTTIPEGQLEAEEDDQEDDEVESTEKLQRVLKAIDESTTYIDDYFSRVAKTVSGVKGTFVILPDEARMKGNFDLYCTFVDGVHEDDKEWIADQFFERIDFEEIAGKKQIRYSLTREVPPAKDLFLVIDYRKENPSAAERQTGFKEEKQF